MRPSRPAPLLHSMHLATTRRQAARTLRRVAPSSRDEQRNSHAPVSLRVGWSLRLALRPTISARERFYADTRSARRGNAPLRQTGSTAGPVLYLRIVRHAPPFHERQERRDVYCARTTSATPERSTATALSVRISASVPAASPADRMASASVAARSVKVTVSLSVPTEPALCRSYRLPRSRGSRSSMTERSSCSAWSTCPGA